MAAKIKSIAARDSRRQFGNRGEDLAAVFLQEHGFRILARNWSCRLGEIDLIAEKDDALHFIEVKTRRSRAFGDPQEAVTRTKLRHVQRAVEVYVAQAGAVSRNYQIDVLAILLLPGQVPQFDFIENVE